jgi:predicted lactoylglutathione lyase
MPRVILVNLRAKDVDRSEVLSAHVGFSFHPRSTDATAASVVLGERTYAALPTRDTFCPFTFRDTCDTTWATRVPACPSSDTR